MTRSFGYSALIYFCAVGMVCAIRLKFVPMAVLLYQPMARNHLTLD